jgi:hypothetical protein
VIAPEWRNWQTRRIQNPATPLEIQALATEGAQEGATPADERLAAATSTSCACEFADLAELAQVTTAWPRLPEHLKAAILTLVNSAKGVSSDKERKPAKRPKR